MQSPLSHGSASCIEEAAAKSNSDQPRHTNLHPGVHPSACRGGPKRHMTPPQLSASGLRELLGWRPLAAYYAPPFVTTPPKEVLKPEKQPVLRRGCAVPPRPASHPTKFSIQRLKRKSKDCGMQLVIGGSTAHRGRGRVTGRLSPPPPAPDLDGTMCIASCFLGPGLLDPIGSEVVGSVERVFSSPLCHSACLKTDRVKFTQPQRRGMQADLAGLGHM